MTYNLEKYLHSKKCLKQRRQPHRPSLQQSRRYFRADKVTWLRLLFAIDHEYAYLAVKSNKAFRLSFTLKGYFLEPRIKNTILKVPSF